MAVRGYLTVTVNQASNRTKANEVVWDDSFREGFVKVEVRGGPRNIKVQSKLQPVSEGMLEWHETLKLEVLEESRELRIVLCREKRSGTRVGSAVVAACGIFVDDILDAVPIDKWFEMFKPGAAGEGGYIRVHMSFSEDKDAKEADLAAAEPLAATENGVSTETRPGVAESFRPQLSGITSDIQSDLQSAQKENRPPLSQGSQTTPSTSTVQRKTDEAVSRETTPEPPEAPQASKAEQVQEQAEVEAENEPIRTYRARQEHHYEREPAIPKRQSNKKQKSGGNKVLKFLGGFLVVAVAGVAALHVKQEFDKRPHTQHEYLVIDDEDLSKKHHVAKEPKIDHTHKAAKAEHDADE